MWTIEVLSYMNIFWWLLSYGTTGCSMARPITPSLIYGINITVIISQPQNLLTTILNMNISFCTAVVPELLLRFGDIVVKQIFNYECLASTAYLLTLRSTGVQEGSRKRTFCCNAALLVSMQWSTELCWMERETKDKRVCCCAFEVEARQIMLSLPPTVLIRKVGMSLHHARTFTLEQQKM